MSVLYDAPGPRARRRALIGSIIALIGILALLTVVVLRLVDAGQFTMARWGALINPGDENFAAVWRLLGEGFLATLVAAGLAIVFSLVIGTLLGAARMMSGRWTRGPIIGLVELLRGLPVVVTIFFVFLALPAAGIRVAPLPGPDGLWYLIIGLVLYNSVIIAEILRAGVASLPRGQREAALAVGMTNGLTMRQVLLPQAFRTMLPALISQLVVVLKDTSLAAVLGIYIELLRRGNLIALNLNNPIQVLFAVALIFIAINYALSRLAVYTEDRLSRGPRAAKVAEVEAVPGAGAAAGA
jgi:glutamate transport system permease protein